MSQQLQSHLPHYRQACLATQQWLFASESVCIKAIWCSALLDGGKSRTCWSVQQLSTKVGCATSAPDPAAHGHKSHCFSVDARRKAIQSNTGVKHQGWRRTYIMSANQCSALQTVHRRPSGLYSHGQNHERCVLYAMFHSDNVLLTPTVCCLRQPAWFLFF
jgi:hypothetical protein